MNTTSIAPHNPDAEAAVIGSCLVYRDAILETIEEVHPDDFYDPTWANIYTAMRSLLAEGGQPIDPVTVQQRCKTLGLPTAPDTPARLLDAMAATPTVNPTRHARIVANDATKRRVLQASTQIRELATSNAEADQVVDGAETLLFEIASHSRTASTLRRIDEIIPTRLDALETRYLDDTTPLDGVPTGFAELDAKLLGLRPGQMITLGARPGMGKSALALNVATHVATQGRPVLICSLEMSGEEVTDRLLSNLSSLPLSAFATGQLSDTAWEQLNQAVTHLAQLPIDIDDNSRLTVMDIRAKARRVKARRRDLGLIVVDYVQLMGSSDRRYVNRQELVSEISRSLKVLAREMECPVLALVQLNRELEKRYDKTPILADIRESGSLEQDSNVVLFLHNPSFYDDTLPRDAAEIVIAKNRSGATGRVHLHWEGQYTRFTDVTPLQQEARRRRA